MQQFISMFSIRPQVWLPDWSYTYLSLLRYHYYFVYYVIIIILFKFLQFFKWQFSDKYSLFLSIPWKCMKILKYSTFFLFWRIDLRKVLSAAGLESPSALEAHFGCKVIEFPKREFKPQIFFLSFFPLHCTQGRF